MRRVLVLHMTDQMLTITQVAELLQVPVETMRKWRAQNSGPQAIKLGRHVRYRPEDVDRWVQEQASEQARR